MWGGGGELISELLLWGGGGGINRKDPYFQKRPFLLSREVDIFRKHAVIIENWKCVLLVINRQIIHTLKFPALTF